MTDLLLNPTATAQWHALVNEAQAATDRPLNEELESYLVFTLMRFTSKPELMARIIALDFLESLLETGRIRTERLRDIGDQCLLVSGLFPQRAVKRRVQISYFVNLGRSAYGELATASVISDRVAEMYLSLSEDFIALMDVLQAMRELGDQEPLLEPLQAFELWQDTRSSNALRILRRYTSDPGSMAIHTDTDQKN